MALNSSAHFNFFFAEQFWTNYLTDTNCSEQNLRCFVTDEKTSSIVGILLFDSVATECQNLPPQSNASNFKRRNSCSTGNEVLKKKFTVESTEQVIRKDVHTALKDLNLMPQISSDLACSMCPYISKRKGDLKVHYKLKHLGGADLIMTCQICSIQVKTKSYMKKHYIKVHNLTESAAQNMTSSSN